MTIRTLMMVVAGTALALALARSVASRVPPGPVMPARPLPPANDGHLASAKS